MNPCLSTEDLLIRFISGPESNSKYTGFSISWEQRCGQEIFVWRTDFEPRVFTNVKYGISTYTPNQDCFWTVVGQEGDLIITEFIDLDIEGRLQNSKNVPF